MSRLSGRRVLVLATAGAVGGLAWDALLGLSPWRSLKPLPGPGRMAWAIPWPDYCIAAGFAIAAALTLAEEISSGSARRAGRRALIGGAAGAGFALLSGPVTDVVAPLIPSARFVLSYAVSDALLGAGIGVYSGVLSRSTTRAWQGLLGGLLGGGLCGAVSMATMAYTDIALGPELARAFMGASIGAAVALVEEVAKQQWLTVLTGSREGRSYILSKRETVLGRDELADIPCFGDASVAKQHARILRDPSQARLEAMPGLAVAVNSQAVASAPLSDGDIIAIGKHRFRFGSRRAGVAAMVPPREVPLSAGYERAPQYPYAETYAAPTPLARLDVVSGPHAGQSFPLGAGPLVIGRDIGCDIVLAGDERVSRRHASLMSDGGRWRIEDLGSTNGLYVNGHRVTSHVLQPGDRIAVGQGLLRVG